MVKWIRRRYASIASALFIGGLASGCAQFERMKVDSNPAVQRRERAVSTSPYSESRSSDRTSRSGY